jgi:hypothetical protein
MDGFITKPRDYQLLSKIFSRTVITELAKYGKSAKIEAIISELSLDTNKLTDISLTSFFDKSYAALVRNYRNEYVFKNAIAEKIVRGKHKLSNATYVTEFRVGKSIVDAAVFNGTSTAYEIKTEYDSFERLDSQLHSYGQVFDKTYVVVPSSKVIKALDVIPETVGVYELTDQYSLSEIKEASSNIDNVCKYQILNSMRQSELLLLIREKFDYIPVNSPSQQKKDCTELFLSFDKEVAHEVFVSTLKARQLQDFEKNIIKTLPRSLTSLILSLRLNKKLLFNFQTCIMDNHII